MRHRVRQEDRQRQRDSRKTGKQLGMEGEEMDTMRPSYAEKKEEIRREMREERKREGAGEGKRDWQTEEL